MKKNILFIGCAFTIAFSGCTKKDSNNTSAPVIALQTTTVTNIKQTSAVSGGSISADGGFAITARGICWGTNPNPTIINNKIAASSGTGTFTANLINLIYNTTYYVRAYAINSKDTAYGTQVSFTAQPFSIPGNGVTDIDGNTYTTIILGDKEWMSQNLRVTKYRNGNLILNPTTNTSWQSAGNTSTGAWCYYNNTPGYNGTYGKLYNWYASTDTGQISPVGWHVPSTGEWDALAAYVGGSSIAGGMLKSVSTSWVSPNTGATNASLFNALPGGQRTYLGNFTNEGTYGIWGTTNPSGFNQIFLRNTQASIGSFYYDNRDGLSIRCVKD